MKFFVLIIFLMSCQAIQRGNERYYYKRTIQIIDQLPDETKEDCGYAFDREMPTMATAERAQFLVFKNEIEYNPMRPNELVHEYQHFFNRQNKGVTWDCLNEVSATYAQRIIVLEDMVNRLVNR